MIEVDHSDPDIVVLHPSGALSEEDFTALAATIDDRINTTDKVPNLVITVDRLPHWDSISALTRHFHFVHEHQAIVKKVAIVGDSPVLTVAPEIANMFVSARVRRFPASKLAEAKEWARAEGDDPGRFEVIDGLPRDVIALRAVGIITAEDYEDTLVPLVEEKLKTHDKLKCLIVLDEDYATYSGDAAWSDMKFGLKRSWHFSRIALVTDIGWIASMARMVSPMMPFQFKAFKLGELDEAKSWIKH